MKILIIKQRLTTVIPSCNSNLTVKSQVFLLVLCAWGFLHPPPALRLRSLMGISVLLGPKQAAHKPPFKLQKIKRGQEHQPFPGGSQTTVQTQL